MIETILYIIGAGITGGAIGALFAPARQGPKGDPGETAVRGDMGFQGPTGIAGRDGQVIFVASGR